MNEPDPVRGALKCPHCPERFFLTDFLQRHLAEEHQETQ